VLCTPLAAEESKVTSFNRKYHVRKRKKFEKGIHDRELLQDLPVRGRQHLFVPQGTGSISKTARAEVFFSGKGHCHTSPEDGERRRDFLRGNARVSGSSAMGTAGRAARIVGGKHQYKENSSLVWRKKEETVRIHACTPEKKGGKKKKVSSRQHARKTP